MALLDNGAQINTIMPNCVKDHSLEMGLITDLVGTRVACVGLGYAYTHPTISHIMNVMKEREIDALAMPWANARVADLLSMHRATATLLEDQTSKSANPNGYNEVVYTRNMDTIEAFSSQVISIKAEKAYTGQCIKIMIQALWTEEGTLSQGLTIQNAYTELWKGSKYVVMVVRNSMAYPQMLQKKVLVARAVAATTVPETPLEIRVQEGDDGP